VETNEKITTTTGGVMYDAPLAADLALGLTHHHLRSARPEAPVVPDRKTRRARRTGRGGSRRQNSRW